MRLWNADSIKAHKQAIHFEGTERDAEPKLTGHAA